MEKCYLKHIGSMKMIMVGNSINFRHTNVFSFKSRRFWPTKSILYYTELKSFLHILGNLKNEDKVLAWLIEQKSKD